MKLEVGKRYVRRDGSITLPLDYHYPNKDGVYAAFLTDGNYFYYPSDEEEGWKVLPLSLRSHKGDLIEEYKGE